MDAAEKVPLRHRPARLLAADRRRVQRRGPVDRGFPPGAIGPRSRRRTPRRSCGGPSPAGGGPSGSGWTTACRGARAGDLPTDLALWLIGLGVGVDWNPPRRPQDNGVVERSQGTAKRWAEPGACASRGGVAAAAGGDGRHPAPGVSERAGPQPPGGVPAVGAFGPGVYAGLGASALEPGGGRRRTWPATRCRGGWTSRGRCRCTTGIIMSGVIHQGKTVHVMFDPEALEWIFADEKGRQLRSRPATRDQPGDDHRPDGHASTQGDRWSVSGQTSCRDSAAKPHVG